MRSKPRNVLGALVLALLGLLAGCVPQLEESPAAELILEGPALGMPKTGSPVTLRVRWGGGLGEAPAGWTFTWSRNGVRLPTAGGPFLHFPSIQPGDAGLYTVHVGTPARVEGPAPFLLEPVDHLRIVTTLDDDGPGTLREAMASLAALGGTGGIAFRLGGKDEWPILRLARPLPPVRGRLRILGPRDRPLILSGDGRLRPLFVNGGDLVLAWITVADGLAQGGNAGGGGGAAPGMGGGSLSTTAGWPWSRWFSRGTQPGGAPAWPGPTARKGVGPASIPIAPARGEGALTADSWAVTGDPGRCTESRTGTREGGPEGATAPEAGRPGGVG